MGKEARPRLSRTYSSCGYFLACWYQGKPQSAWVGWPPKFHCMAPKRPIFWSSFFGCLCPFSAGIQYFLKLQIPNVCTVFSANSQLQLSSLKYSSPYCRAFHPSLWNKRGNILKSVFYPFCVSSKSSLYKFIKSTACSCSSGALGPEIQCVLDPCIWSRIDTCLEYFCQKSAPSELSFLEKAFQMSLHRSNLKSIADDLLANFWKSLWTIFLDSLLVIPLWARCYMWSF